MDISIAQEFLNTDYDLEVTYWDRDNNVECTVTGKIVDINGREDIVTVKGKDFARDIHSSNLNAIEKIGGLKIGGD